MPELPEVETIVRHLNRDVEGSIESVFCGLSRIYEGRLSVAALSRVLKNKSLQIIKRRGKYLLFFFNKSPVVLIVHLGMSGQLMFGPSVPPGNRQEIGTLKAKSTAPLEAANSSFRTLTGLEVFRPGGAISLDKHCHFVIRFKKNRLLVFRDPRTFGKIILSEVPSWKEHPRIKKLGAEPLEMPTSQILKKYWPKDSKRCVKALLLDQAIIAGVGNIYADEALFKAGVHPQTKAADLPPAEVKKLLKEVKGVLRKGIKHFGTTFSNFVHPDGQTGDNYEHLQVYGCGGKPCKRCGQPLVKSIVAGRGSVFCVKCQM